MERGDEAHYSGLNLVDPGGDFVKILQTHNQSLTSCTKASD